MIKEMLFTNWHFMRWLRLGIGLFITVQTVQTHDVLSGLIAAFFLFQAATNTGCGGAAGCATMPMTKSNVAKTDDIEFEEVK